MRNSFYTKNDTAFKESSEVSAELINLDGRPLFASANTTDTSERAEMVQDTITPAALSVPGVNSIGITGCNSKTGLKDLSKNFVYCVEIGAETVEAFLKLKSFYPAPTKINGIYITITKHGPFEIQPRMSGGR